jgi:hypothetical protein
VGAGWFVVDYATGESPNVDDTGWIPYPDVEGGVSLVSPNGTWYAAVEHDSLGAGPVGAWDGANLWMLREATTNFESIQSTAELFNMAEGSTTAVPGESSGRLAPFAPGRALYYAWGGGGLVNSLSAVDKTEQMGGCSDIESGFWGWEAQDMSFLYNPAQGGAIVCFGPSGRGSGTSVQHVRITILNDTVVINEFSRSPDQYAFAGWIDEYRFFFARTGGATPVMFEYDLRDDSITEVDLPIYDDVNGWNTTGYFDRASQRHVIAARDEEGWVVNLTDEAGAQVASLAGACGGAFDQYSRADVRVSGGRMMVACAVPGYVEMYDLADGSKLGHWDVGMERATAIFDTPDG